MAMRTATRIGWTSLAVLALVLTGVAGAKESKVPKVSKASKAPAVASPLDGLVFVGETGREGETKGRSDKFAFNGGKFRAAAFSAYGFNDAAYESDVTDESVSFAVAVVSTRSSGGSMHWTGTLSGGVLEGTMRWDHGWESKHYWFRGRARAQQSGG